MTSLTDAVNGLPRILGHAYPDAIRKTDALRRCLTWRSWRASCSRS